MQNDGTDNKAKRALTEARAKSRAHKKASTMRCATARLVAERIEQEREAIGPLSLSSLSDASTIEKTAVLEGLINEYLCLTLGKSAR